LLGHGEPELASGYEAEPGLREGRQAHQLLVVRVALVADDHEPDAAGHGRDLGQILALDTEADAASLHALIEKENEGKAHFGLGLAFIGPWLAGDAPAVHKPIAGLLGELGAAHPKASPGRQHFEPEDGVIERLSLLGELLDDSGIHVRILEPGI